MLKNIKSYVISALVLGGVIAMTTTLAQSPIPSFESYPTSGPEMSGSVSANPSTVAPGGTITFNATLTDPAGVETVILKIMNGSGVEVARVTLYDDGTHADGSALDDIFGNTWNTGTLSVDNYTIDVETHDRLGLPSTFPGSGLFKIDTGGGCVNDADCPGSDICCPAISACIVLPNCDDGDPGTIDGYNTSTCETGVGCTNILNCTNGDGQCYPGCDWTNDSDCSSCDLVTSDTICPTGCDFTTDIDCAAPDTTSPVITFVSPTGTEPIPITVANTDIIVTGYDPSGLLLSATSLVEGFEFSLDGTLMFTEYAPTGSDTVSPGAVATWIFNWSSVANGTHTVMVQVKDAFNNLNSATITVDVQIPAITAPTVAITAPADGSIFASTAGITFTIAAQDDSIVTLVELYSTGGGGPLASSVTSTPSVVVNANVLGSSIAMVTDTISSYAMERSGFKLPFVETAQAAEIAALVCPPGYIEVCNSCSTTAAKIMYAMAYDDTGLSTVSATITVNITTAGTCCSCVLGGPIVGS